MFVDRADDQWIYWREVGGPLPMIMRAAAGVKPDVTDDPAGELTAEDAKALSMMAGG